MYRAWQSDHENRIDRIELEPWSGRQPESAPVEAEQVRELPADIPSTLVDPSVIATPVNLLTPVAPAVASREKSQKRRQSGTDKTSGNPSSAQLLYALWEAQLTELEKQMAKPNEERLPKPVRAV